MEIVAFPVRGVHMRKVFSNKIAITLFMLPALLFFVFVIALPVIMSTGYSFTEWNGFGEMKFLGWDNFKRLFADNMDNFPDAVKNSLLFLVISVGIQIPISLLFALILANKTKGSGFFRTVFFIPVVMSTTVIGQLWLKVYHPQYGILNVFLEKIGLENFQNAWLAEKGTVLLAVFIPILWQYVGYHMLLLYAGIKNISPDIYEAAEIDGANRFQIARKITLPLILPMLQVSLIFSVTGSLKVFDLIYVLTAGGPAGASEVPSTLMVRTIFNGYQYGYGSAMAVFIIIECFIVTALVKLIFSKLEKKY